MREKMKCCQFAKIAMLQKLTKLKCEAMIISTFYVRSSGIDAFSSFLFSPQGEPPSAEHVLGTGIRGSEQILGLDSLVDLPVKTCKLTAMHLVAYVLFRGRHYSPYT